MAEVGREEASRPWTARHVGGAVAGASALAAFNWWAAHLEDERLRKRVLFVQMMAVLEVVVAVTLRYYLYPVLVHRVAWGSRVVQVWLTRGLAVLGACAMAMYPLMRGLAHLLPVTDEPPAAQLAVFAAFGIVLVLAMVTAVADVAERVTAAAGVVAAAACRRCCAPTTSAAPPTTTVAAAKQDTPAPPVAGVPGSSTRRRAAAAAAPAVGMVPPLAALGPAPSQPQQGGSTVAALASTLAWQRQRGVAWGAAVLATTTAIVVPALMNAQTAPRVVEVAVPLLRLPPALDGYRIVQLSDVHAGPTVGAAQVRRLVQLANSLRGDMVVLTGDVIDGDEAQYAGVVAPLAELTAPEVYFCSGNHDSYDGSYPAKVAILESLRVRVLHNTAVAVPAAAAAAGGPTFDLLGVGDWAAAVLSGPEWAANLTAAAARLDPSRESVLLAHQPKHMAETRQFGIGLQLSGHTHGGQIAPLHIPVYFGNPFFAGYYLVPTPASTAPDRLATLVASFATAAADGSRLPAPALRAPAGEPATSTAARAHALWRALAAGDWPTQLYVSRGSVYWGPPMRFLAPQEVTVVTLRSVPAMLTTSVA